MCLCKCEWREEVYPSWGWTKMFQRGHTHFMHIHPYTLHAGLDEDQVKELAYAIFAACCAQPAGTNAASVAAMQVRKS